MKYLKEIDTRDTCAIPSFTSIRHSQNFLNEALLKVFVLRYLSWATPLFLQCSQHCCNNASVPAAPWLFKVIDHYMYLNNYIHFGYLIYSIYAFFNPPVYLPAPRARARARAVVPFLELISAEKTML